MKALLLTSTSAVLLLAGCSKEPAEQYRLSQDQLAWQGYQAGKVIRFGNSSNASVRTYTITSVQDAMEKQYVYPGALPLPSRELPQCQRVTVKIQRTDSAAPAVIALNLELYLNRGYNTAGLRAEAGWDKLYSYARLPLDEVNKSQPVDTLLYPRTTLLPSATFGGTTYATVIRVASTYPAALSPRTTRLVYYAKGRGVVAFAEDRTGLWYRIP